MCCCIRKRDQQEIKSKIPTPTGEAGVLSWKGYTHQGAALWFGALPIPQHSTAYKAAPCTLGLTKLASKQPSWNKWTEQLQMETSQNNALSQSHCHETALPERHSTVKGCERNTVKSEKYKVEVESFKPAQECQFKNSSLFFLPTGFSSSWITEQGCVSQSTQCLFLSKTLFPPLPFPNLPLPSGLYHNHGLPRKAPGLRASLGDFTQNWDKTSFCSGKQRAGIWITLGDLTWWFYAEFKSRSKESLPFWGTRVSSEFTCIQPCTPAQLCLPSPHKRKAPISSGTGCWSYWGPPGHCQLSGDRHWKHSSSSCTSQEMSHPCACRRQLKHLEGSWMRQALTQAQTRPTEHARATIKAEQ